MSDKVNKKTRDIMFEQGTDILKNMSRSDKAKLTKKFPNLFQDIKDGKVSTKEIVNFITESSLPGSNKKKVVNKKTGGKVSKGGAPHNRLY